MFQGRSLVLQLHLSHFSNMMTQTVPSRVQTCNAGGVPLVKPEAPLVGTGMEYHAALYSGNMVLAKHDGIVKNDGRRIVIPQN